MTLVALGFVGIVGAIVLMFMPRRFMPALALAVLVVLPVGYMDVPRLIGRYFSPAVIILAVWMIRTVLSTRDAPAAPVRVGTLLWIPVLGAVAVTVALGLAPGLSVVWVLVVLVCVVLPYLYGRTRHDEVWVSSQSAYLWIGVFVGGLAVLDFIAGFNPWSSLFSYDVTDKVWSVFRTRTSLGHPLVTSTVATVCAMIALFGSDTRRWLRIAALAGSGAAVILAVSRTGVLAVAIGLALGCLVLLFGASPSKRTRRVTAFFLMVSAVGFLGVVTNSPLLEQRNDSTGGVKSSDYREQSTAVAADLISDNWLIGLGPGNSAAQFSSVFDGPLENSVLQLLLSLGIPLAALALSAVVVIVLRVSKRGDAGVAAAIVAFCVSLTGFSAIDVNPALLVFLTPLMYRAGQVIGSIGSFSASAETSRQNVVVPTGQRAVSPYQRRTPIRAQDRTARRPTGRRR
ncbi:O-antigen ligase [Rathayibacter sp. VKM Ac-2928]|uniref:O-antigen ligase family protein n=1 Tax=Rathayibacter sp. VKM Ac-2928 TaxID=2929479 RepID=UPI001FB5210B|nr:O-antigen ligase family protein [Rathayibacter sp. VKM Ac-2928]MCJ1682414.1 O-antigen ligase family protein [Rathayibacter sp. VKM Ac-2928]